MGLLVLAALVFFAGFRGEQRGREPVLIAPARGSSGPAAEALVSQVHRPGGAAEAGLGDAVMGVVADNQGTHNKMSDYFFIDIVGRTQLITESAEWFHTVVTDQMEKEDGATEPPTLMDRPWPETALAWERHRHALGPMKPCSWFFGPQCSVVCSRTPLAGRPSISGP